MSCKTKRISYRTYLKTTGTYSVPTPPAAQYYNSDLSIWLSVDPLVDKYPNLSPYVYCANNPVRLVDEDGMDWFENELTGDVYYARDYRKGDEHLIDGEGWKWMGENGMFGKPADDVIFSNYQTIEPEIYSGDETIGRAAYKGENAKKFMNTLGYEFKPSVLKVDIIERQQICDFGSNGEPIYLTTRNESPSVINSTYVKKGIIPSFVVLQSSPYNDKQLGPFIRETTWTEIRQNNYINSSNDYKNVIYPILQTALELLKDIVPLVHK